MLASGPTLGGCKYHKSCGSSIKASPIYTSSCSAFQRSSRLFSDHHLGPMERRLGIAKRRCKLRPCPQQQLLLAAMFYIQILTLFILLCFCFFTPSIQWLFIYFYKINRSRECYFHFLVEANLNNGFCNLPAALPYATRAQTCRFEIRPWHWPPNNRIPWAHHHSVCPI